METEYRILRQFCKALIAQHTADMSDMFVKNELGAKQVNIKVFLGVVPRALGGNMFEVNFNANVIYYLGDPDNESTHNNLLDIKVQYAAITEMLKKEFSMEAGGVFSDDALLSVLMMEIPKDLLPFLRFKINTAAHDSGYNSFNIDSTVDLTAIYNEYKKTQMSDSESGANSI